MPKSIKWAALLFFGIFLLGNLFFIIPKNLKKKKKEEEILERSILNNDELSKTTNLLNQKEQIENSQNRILIEENEQEFSTMKKVKKMHFQKDFSF